MRQRVVELALQSDRSGQDDGVHALLEPRIVVRAVQVDHVHLLVGVEAVVVGRDGVKAIVPALGVGP